MAKAYGTEYMFKLTVYRAVFEVFLSIKNRQHRSLRVTVIANNVGQRCKLLIYARSSANGVSVYIDSCETNSYASKNYVLLAPSFCHVTVYTRTVTSQA